MIVISTDVFCDICGEWFHGGISHRIEIRKARREARAAGWFRCRSPISGKMSDICPHCAIQHLGTQGADDEAHQ